VENTRYRPTFSTGTWVIASNQAARIRHNGQLLKITPQIVDNFVDKAVGKYRE